MYRTWVKTIEEKMVRLCQTKLVHVDQRLLGISCIILVLLYKSEILSKLQIMKGRVAVRWLGELGDLTATMWY